jgi:DNA-directed RNA polymerase specialized sigma54-like protein
MNSQGKVALVAILGLLISIGLFVFVIKPNLAKVEALNKDAVAKKSELKQLEEQITIYQNSQRDLAKATGKEIISNSLLERENLQYAIIEIEQAAATTQVEESMEILEQTTTSKTAPKQLVSGKSFLDEVNYTVKTTSDFMQLINFMKYLEHMSHFTEVSKITLQATAGAANSEGIFVHDGNILGSIDLVFFVQKK